MEASQFVLGVDGGGTKTVAWLAPLAADGGQTALGRGQAGPGNPRAAGFSVAQANIDAAIAAAFADAGIPRQPVAAACFGLAGAGRAAEQQQITDWALGRRIAERINVTGDAEPILATAAPDNTGVVLICGTGSLAWGRNAAGQTARCGGWGYLLGDEGSGYAIALAGLRAAVRAADGRGPATELLPAFMQRLGAASPEELVGRVYAADMKREGLAGLASLVFECRSSDPVATQIVADAAGSLAELVVTVVRQLHLPPSDVTLALAGGTLVHQPQYREQLLSALKHAFEMQGARPIRWTIVEQPVQGAVALARSLCA